MRIETRRLLLRYAIMKDARKWAEQIGNLNVSRYLLHVPYPYTLKDAKGYVRRCRKRRQEKPGKDYSFLIELKSERALIGGIGLDDVDTFQGTADIAFWVGESYWGQGYGTEAGSALLNFAFDHLHLRKIKIPVYVENAASNALARKLGGVLEGTLRQQSRAKSTGKIHDENIYGILKEEWVRTRKKLK